MKGSNNKTQTGPPQLTTLALSAEGVAGVRGGLGWVVVAVACAVGVYFAGLRLQFVRLVLSGMAEVHLCNWGLCGIVITVAAISHNTSNT